MSIPEVAFGFTNTTDYEMKWDSSYLESLACHYQLTLNHIIDHKRIGTMQELLGSIFFHFSQGTGCGMYVESQKLIDQVLSGGQSRVTLGGTAVRAALALNRLGCPSLVHLVSQNEDTLRLLPPQINWVCSQKGVTHYPHMAIQFPEGAQLKVAGRTLEAPRSNRVIYTSDLDNACLRITPKFFVLARDCKVMVISSFDIVQDRTILIRRLSTVRRLIDQHPIGWVFYEDAHFTHPGFPPLIWKVLLPAIHMYSMNEEEFFGYAGKILNLLSPEEVLQGLELVMKKIPVPCLIVHTRYWALAYGTLAETARAGLDAGITVAATRYKLGDDWTARDLQQTRLTPLQPEAIAFARRITASNAQPLVVYPCYDIRADHVTTVGLGDSFVGGFVSALRHEQPATV